MNLYKKAKGVSVYFAADCPDLRKNEIRPGSCKIKLRFASKYQTVHITPSINSKYIVNYLDDI
jgi:hypothetical protein